MFQAFPYYSLLVEGLPDLSALVDGENNRATYSPGPRRTVLGVHSNTFSANLRSVEGPFVHIAKTS